MTRRSAALRCVLASGVALALTSCATTQSGDALAAWQNETRAALQRHDDLASRVASALLLDWPLGPVGPLDARVVMEIRDAAALMPEDRRIAALHVVTCLAAADCDASDAVAALRQIDPGNGIAEWPALSAAVASGVAAAIDDAMHKLATADRFEVYLIPTVVSIADALVRSGAPETPGGRAARDGSAWAITAMGALTVRGVPPLEPLGTACRGPDLSDERRHYCLTTLATLLQSDAVILQSLSSALIHRLAAPESPEAAAASEWRRHMEWRSVQQTKLWRPTRIRKFAREYLAALRAHRREEDAVRAVLVAFDLPPDPPENWTPPLRLPAR